MTENNDFPYWDHIKKELNNPSIYNKAKNKFVKNNCIEYFDKNTWIVRPIKGYNSTTYVVDKIKDDFGQYSFKCSCQGFNKWSKPGTPTCSHIIAVKLYAGREQRNKKIERDAKLISNPNINAFNETPGVRFPW